MKHRLGIPVVLLSLVVMVANACGVDSTVGSRFVKSERVAASKGAAISVSATEEPELAGTSLDVPPGALATDTTLTLELGLKPLTGNARGPVAIWGPAGTLFSSPVRMTLPLAMTTSSEVGLIEIQVEEADGRRFTIPNSELTVDATGTSVSFKVNGFTRFQPAVAARDAGAGGGTAGGTASAGGTGSAGGTAQATCSSSAQCARGETCVFRNPGAPGVCVVQSAGGGSAAGGTAQGGGTASAGGAAAGGGTAAGTCTSSTQCPRGETCSMRTPGTVGVCVGPSTGGGSAGGGTASGGGTSGTGGGTPMCGTCASGETCWFGSCRLIPCDPVRGCPSPLSCVSNSCQ
jgi:hypothetical protein